MAIEAMRASAKTKMLRFLFGLEHEELMPSRGGLSLNTKRELEKTRRNSRG